MRARDAADESEIKTTLISDPDVGFTMLVRRYQPGIYSGARRLTRSHQEAEEVAQETFLRAYRAIESYGEPRIRNLRIPGWLWTIALNLCRDRGSKRMIESPGLTEVRTAVSDDVPIDSEAWSRRLASLSDSQRTAVVLRHVADLPIADISVATGRPVGTVKADISRGLDRLRATMKGEASQ